MIMVPGMKVYVTSGVRCGCGNELHNSVPNDSDFLVLDCISQEDCPAKGWRYLVEKKTGTVLWTGKK